MKQNLEEAVTRAEEIINHVRSRPSAQRYSTPSSAKWKSLPQKLYDMYIEEIQKDPENKKVRYGCHLLDKLANREKLQWQCLIVNLYPGNQGYSLMLPGNNLAESETVKLPYAESEFLDFIDNEELPPILVDLIEQTHPFLFYNGCVITEVKDYRQSPNGQSYASRHVLLRPTQQSVVADVNAITSDGHLWTMDDKIQLESQLILATQSPLCLDPSLSVSCVANKLHNEKHRFNTKSIRRCLKRYSQVAKNRKAIQRRMPAPPELRLHDFLSKRKNRNAVLAVDLKIGKPGVDLWQQRPLDIQKVDSLNILELASCPDKPKMTNDNTPITIEEIILETERSNGKIHHAKLTIQQRQSDSCYLGELYSDKDHTSQEGRRLGATTKFLLGTRHNAQRYLNQFQDLHTEEGRRPVKITRIVPGHPPQVVQSANYPHAPSSSTQSTGHDSTNTNQQKPSGPIVVKTEPSGDVEFAGTQVKRSRRLPPPPLKLSVSLSNAGSLSTNFSNSTQQMQISGGNIQSQPITISTQGSSNSQSFTNQALSLLQQQGSNRPQPPAYLSLNRSCSISADGPSIVQSPVGTPTNTPVSVTVGAQLGFPSLPGSITPQSINQSIKSPPPPATPPPRHTSTPTTLRRLSMDDRTVQGSMAPPATPPMLSTSSATPPPPSPKGLLNTATGQEVSISLANVSQASLPQAGVAVALTMDGGSIALPITGLVNHSQAGLVQSSTNLINTPIGVMTSLGSLISNAQGIIPLQTAPSTSSNTIAITNTTQAKLNSAQLVVGKSGNVVNLSGSQLPVGIGAAELSQLLAVMKNAQAVRSTGGNQQLQNVSLLQLPTTNNLLQRSQNISQSASTVASIRQAAKTQQRQQIVYNTNLQQHTPHLNTVLQQQQQQQQQQQLQQQTFQTNQTQDTQTQIQRANSAQLLTGTNLSQLAQLPAPVIQQAIQQQQQQMQQQQQQQQLQQQQQRQQVQQQIAAQQAFSKQQQLWQQHKAATKPKAKKKK